MSRVTRTPPTPPGLRPGIAQSAGSPFLPALLVQSLQGAVSPQPAPAAPLVATPPAGPADALPSADGWEAVPCGWALGLHPHAPQSVSGDPLPPLPTPSPTPQWLQARPAEPPQAALPTPAVMPPVPVPVSPGPGVSRPPTSAIAPDATALPIHPVSGLPVPAVPAVPLPAPPIAHSSGFAWAGFEQVPADGPHLPPSVPGAVSTPPLDRNAGAQAGTLPPVAQDGFVDAMASAAAIATGPALLPVALPTFKAAATAAQIASAHPWPTVAPGRQGVDASLPAAARTPAALPLSADPARALALHTDATGRQSVVHDLTAWAHGWLDQLAKANGEAPWPATDPAPGSVLAGTGAASGQQPAAPMRWAERTTSMASVASWSPGDLASGTARAERPHGRIRSAERAADAAPPPGAEAAPPAPRQVLLTVNEDGCCTAYVRDYQSAAPMLERLVEQLRRMAVSDGRTLLRIVVNGRAYHDHEQSRGDPHAG